MRRVLIFLPIVLISCSSKPESSNDSSEKTTVSSSTSSSSPDYQAFLDKAAAEPGAIKTASGLVYRVITAGSGASPKATDTVKVNYRGTLINGKEFDSSYARNEPAEFPLNMVIPCWTEGVQMMKVGGKSRLVCPASIAYGDRGAPPDIPGGATLVFEIELLGITK
jgi:FKBP-type peptidyl-prolyl cis-trans isomerase FkpA